MTDPHFEREKAKYEHPIPSREYILVRMEEIGEPASFKRIAKELALESAHERDALRLRMNAMVRDGQLVKDRRNVYAIAGKMALITGRILAHPDGFGFVDCDDDREDIFLSHRQMRAVFHGDRVMVRVRGKDRRGRDEGEIVEVIERGTTELVGRICFENQVVLLEALNKRIDHEILIEGDKAQLVDGQIAVGRIVHQPTMHGLPVVEVIQILGEHLTPDLEVEIALRNNDVPYQFPDEVLAEVDRLPYEVPAKQKTNRRDLTGLDFVTIDGEDARDFDDAVFCERRPRGGYRLYVAIADVAAYVKVGSRLDSEAYDRGTSVYFPQYVVPMLPEKLSNGLCSLVPDEDRLALVCEMTISARGRLSSYLFYEGVINSKDRLTYTDVGNWIAADSFPKHEDSLSALTELTRISLRNRQERGALDFDTTEVSIQLAEDGRVESIHPVSRNFAHRLIEECMLYANVSAARLLDKLKIPALYRVHEKPEVDKVEYVREFLNGFGIDLGGGSHPDPADYQAAINQLRGKKNGHVLQISILRSMQQAVYQPENRGHFGLSFSHYTHFTSPIRRFPDLLTHRAIKSVIHGDRQCKEVEKSEKPQKQKFYPFTKESVVAMGEHLSFAERRADDAVYEVLEWVKCDYVSEHVGDDFEGAITSVTKFGFFVELNELYVEGLVHISTLTRDYYHFDQGNGQLIGERTGEAFGMGDVVVVQVARVDVDERKIDFELVSHSPLRRARRKKVKTKKHTVRQRDRSRKKGRRKRR